MYSVGWNEYEAMSGEDWDLGGEAIDDVAKSWKRARRKGEGDDEGENREMLWQTGEMAISGSQ